MSSKHEKDLPMSASRVDKGASAAKLPMSLGNIIDSIGLSRTHYVALFLVVMGGLFEVLEQLILSSLGPSLEVAFGIGAREISLLSTVTLLSVVVGGISGGMLGDRFGRRTVLAVSLAIYCFGTVFSAFAPTYGVLALSRVVTGIGVGGEIAVGLTYLSELAPTKARGVFVSLFNTVSAGIGYFLVFAYTLFVLGPFANLVNAGPEAWRWAFGLLGLPAVLIVFFRRYLPETPAYLLRQGDIEGTNRALTRLAQGKLRLHQTDHVVEYVDSKTASISESAEHEDAGHRGLSSVFKRPLRQRTVVLATAAFMAWGVAFSITIIMPLLLVDRGYSIAGSLTLAMIQNLGGFVGAVAATFASYALSRRRVVFWSAIGGAASVLAFAFFANSDAAVLVLGFMIMFFVLLVNTTIWLWAPELYPTKVRAFGTSLIVNIGFLGGALMPLVVATVFHNVGVVPSFEIVAGMYVILAVAVIFALETRGVSLETLHGSHKQSTKKASLSE